MWHLSMLMVAWGVCLSLYWPSLFGWLGDSHGRDRLEAATGAVNLSWATGALAGGLLGGWLYAAQGSLAFAWAAVPVVVACGAMVLSPCPHSRPARAATSSRTPGTRRTLVAVWLGNMSVCSLLGLMESVFPGLGQRIGVDAPAFGMLMAVLGLGRMPVFVMAFSRGRWFHDWRVGVGTQLVVSGMVATVAWTSAHWWLAAIFLALGLAAGINYYRALFKSLEGEGARGFKSGLHEASLMAGFLLGSLASGVVAEHWGLRAPYVPMALVSVGLVAAQWILLRSASRAQGDAAVNARGA
jgi:predicted MFS family arabinose efflux permease